MRDILHADHFLLGTFSSNCSSGMTVTKVPERWSGSWDDNLALARMLDAAGVDFMLPIARWIGYGGETDFHHAVLEPMTWATALLAATERLVVFATLHTAAHHPVVAAKQLATADQVGHGRVGLNVVAGWNRPEYEALGLTLPQDHETRYALAQEWLDVVERLWTAEAPFDWHGERFDLRGVMGAPRPVDGRPPILNAAGSPQGRDFAVRNADFLFTPAIDIERSREEVAALKAQGTAAGRRIGVLTFAHVCCRPTEAEAREVHDWYARENADWEAVDNLVALQFANAQSFPHDLLALIRDRMAVGHGGYPLIGTPAQVANGIVQLANAGFSGCTLSFLDYAQEFPYVRDEVLPILVERGLRPEPRPMDAHAAQ